MTANIAFFDKALTLFANAASLASLSDDQREAINTAAREMTGRAPASIPSENDLIGKFCSEGQIVVARDRAVKAIVRASLRVYVALEQNAQTRRFIAAIRRLKRRDSGAARGASALWSEPKGEWRCRGSVRDAERYLPLASG